MRAWSDRIDAAKRTLGSAAVDVVRAFLVSAHVDAHAAERTHRQLAERCALLRDEKLAVLSALVDRMVAAEAAPPAERIALATQLLVESRREGGRCGRVPAARLWELASLALAFSHTDTRAFARTQPCLRSADGLEGRRPCQRRLAAGVALDAVRAHAWRGAPAGMGTTTGRARRVGGAKGQEGARNAGGHGRRRAGVRSRCRGSWTIERSMNEFCIEHIMYRTPHTHTPPPRAACARAYCCLCAFFAKASFMPLMASSASFCSEPRTNGVPNFHGHFKTMSAV